MDHNGSGFKQAIKAANEHSGDVRIVCGTTDSPLVYLSDDNDIKSAQNTPDVIEIMADGSRIFIDVGSIVAIELVPED